MMIIIMMMIWLLHAGEKGKAAQTSAEAKEAKH